MASKRADGLGHLVGLQRPDQMQLDLGKDAAQRRPFAGGLLHPVLAEEALAGFQRRHDVGSALGLRHRHQADAVRRAPGGRGRGRDARFDRGQAVGGVLLSRSSGMEGVSSS